MADHFVILDGNALVHRSFHALPPLTDGTGNPTGAVYGFFMVVLKILLEQKPKYMAATFDLKAPTFRHEKYKEYKAKRVAAPDELYAQFAPVKELLALLGVPIYEKAGFEADDIIGTLAALASQSSERPLVDIVTGDLDALQLITDNVHVLSFARGLKDDQIYDVKSVEERYGLKPEQLIDYKALRGDTSDNIPGVFGIGAKTALELLKQHGSLEKIYAHLPDIKESWQKKLKDHQEMAWLSRELVTIKRDVPVNFSLERCRLGQGDFARLQQRFVELKFNSLTKRLQQVAEYYHPKQTVLL